MVVGAACVFLFSPCVPAGEVYRWVDEQGRIQYGDRPPANGATRMEFPKAPESYPESVRDRETREKLLDVLEDDRVERENRKAESVAEAGIRRANCERAQTQLEKMRNATYLFEPSGDPQNPRILTDEERAATTRAVDQEVQKWCGAAASER